MIKVALIACAMAASPAYAINKCTDANGKISFQDAACTGKGEALTVKPASGHSAAPEVAAGASAPAAPTGTAQRIEALKAERIRREKWVVLNDARRSLSLQQASCETDQRELQATKALSNNNLAGATRDASISQEMIAAATMCSQKTRALEKQVEAAEKVCQEIKCIAAH